MWLVRWLFCLIQPGGLHVFKEFFWNWLITILRAQNRASRLALSAAGGLGLPQLSDYEGGLLF